MKEKIINTKQFHIIMIILIIAVILAIGGLLTIRYREKGETNLPFDLTKITVISSIEGTDIEDSENRWNLKVDQNNDIYLYIEKNNGYKETEAIDTIILNNFQVKQNSKIGEIKLYKVDSKSESKLFKNIEENEAEEIEYNGELEANIKESKISNQGGLLVFRYSIANIGNYKSNEDEEINHDKLLKKININNQDLQFNVTFTMTIKLKSGKIYTGNIDLELPTGNVVENGTQSKENTNLDNIVFKREEK